MKIRFSNTWKYRGSSTLLCIDIHILGRTLFEITIYGNLNSKVLKNNIGGFITILGFEFSINKYLDLNSWKEKI